MAGEEHGWDRVELEKEKPIVVRWQPSRQWGTRSATTWYKEFWEVNRIVVVLQLLLPVFSLL